MKTSISTLPIPDLSDNQFVGAVCGLRPCRHNGIRIEIEEFEKQTIVHNYGHGGCGVTISFGTAEIAANLVDEVATAGDQIAVLGGGVVGLTMARELLNKGYRVQVYADKFGLETTSNIAGALWLPMAVEFGDSTKDHQREIQILTRSHQIFQSIDRQRYGVEKLPIFEPADSNTQLGVFGHLFDHKFIDYPEEIDEFPFKCTAKPGQRFTTDFIHTHQFLEALIEDIHLAGGEFQQQSFESKDDIRGLEETVLVNCLALSSREIFGDKNVYPARGVLVHMKPQNLGYGIHDGFRYMFPRSNALILGGCFHEYDWNQVPDQEMIDEILNHHRRFFGQL